MTDIGGGEKTYDASKDAIPRALESGVELSGLKKLNISSSGLVSVHSLNSLPSLEVLNVSFNVLTRPPDLSGLKSLRKLDLSHNRLRSLSWGDGGRIGDVDGLEWLNVGHNYLTSLTELSGARSLHTLWVHENRLEDSVGALAVLESLVSLRALCVFGNGFLGLGGVLPPRTSRVETDKTARAILLAKCPGLTKLVFRSQEQSGGSAGLRAARAAKTGVERIGASHVDAASTWLASPNGQRVLARLNGEEAMIMSTTTSSDAASPSRSPARSKQQPSFVDARGRVDESALRQAHLRDRRKLQNVRPTVPSRTSKFRPRNPPDSGDHLSLSSLSTEDKPYTLSGGRTKKHKGDSYTLSGGRTEKYRDDPHTLSGGRTKFARHTNSSTNSADIQEALAAVHDLETKTEQRRKEDKRPIQQRIRDAKPTVPSRKVPKRSKAGTSLGSGGQDDDDDPLARARRLLAQGPDLGSPPSKDISIDSGGQDDDDDPLARARRLLAQGPDLGSPPSKDMSFDGGEKDDIDDDDPLARARRLLAQGPPVGSGGGVSAASPKKHKFSGGASPKIHIISGGASPKKSRAPSPIESPSRRALREALGAMPVAMDATMGLRGARGRSEEEDSRSKKKKGALDRQMERLERVARLRGGLPGSSIEAPTEIRLPAPRKGREKQGMLDVVLPEDRAAEMIDGDPLAELSPTGDLVLYYGRAGRGGSRGNVAVKARGVDGSAMAKWPEGPTAVNIDVDIAATRAASKAGHACKLYSAMATCREGGGTKVCVSFTPLGAGSISTPDGTIRLQTKENGSGAVFRSDGSVLATWDTAGTLSDPSISSVFEFRLGKHLAASYNVATRHVRILFQCENVRHAFVQGYNPPSKTWNSTSDHLPPMDPTSTSTSTSSSSPTAARRAAAKRATAARRTPFQPTAPAFSSISQQETTDPALARIRSQVGALLQNLSNP